MQRDIAALLLVDGSGRILLQLRTKDAPFFPGWWGFFGGGVETGETPREALRREAEEELAYRVRAPLLALSMPYQHQHARGILHVFLEPYDPSQLLELREGQGMGWFFPREVEKLHITPHDLAALLQANIVQARRGKDKPEG